MMICTWTLTSIHACEYNYTCAKKTLSGFNLSDATAVSVTVMKVSPMIMRFSSARHHACILSAEFNYHALCVCVCAYIYIHTRMHSNIHTSLNRQMPNDVEESGTNSASKHDSMRLSSQ
jgi:hypothetical protein